MRTVAPIHRWAWLDGLRRTPRFFDRSRMIPSSITTLDFRMTEGSIGSTYKARFTTIPVIPEGRYSSAARIRSGQAFPSRRDRCFERLYAEHLWPRFRLLGRHHA